MDVSIALDILLATWPFMIAMFVLVSLTSAQKHVAATLGVALLRVINGVLAFGLVYNKRQDQAMPGTLIATGGTEQWGPFGILVLIMVVCPTVLGMMIRHGLEKERAISTPNQTPGTPPT